MTSFFGESYVTQTTDIVFDPSGGQFGPDVNGFEYSEFFGVGEDDLVGDNFSIGGPVIVDIPFKGDTQIFTARLFGEIGAQFGLQINSALDPGSVDAILPYETVVGYPDFDVATIADGDVVDLFFGATFDPGADPESGFTTEFPRFTFEIGILTELVVKLAAEIGIGSDSDIYGIVNFTVPETLLPILSVDTARDITTQEAAENDILNEGDANPIEVFGITTPELVDEIDGLDPAFNDAGEFAGIGIPLNTFVSAPETENAEKTVAPAEGDGAEESGPGFDLTSIDLGKFEIFVPDINTVSKLVDGVFVTDPTKKAEYNYLEDEGGSRILDENGAATLLSILRVDDLDADGNNLGEGNRDDLVRLTLDLDGLITYASGGTFPPLELGPLDLLDGGISLGGPLGTLSRDAGFSYNLLDVELEAALPLEQEFTLTPRLQTQLRFFDVNPDGTKGEAKAVEVQMQQKVLRFDETGIFQDDTITARLRELAAGNDTFAQDIDLFLDLDAGIAGAFTGQTASIGGRMIISRDGGRTWQELFTNAADSIAESAPSLGQDQTVDLTLSENTLLGYRLFIGSGSAEIREDYVIEFDKSDTVYVEDIEETSDFITETPFLDDLNTLNVVYDNAETFVEIVSKAIPIVTNRTGLEFDLALLLSGLAASATFDASYDIGPFSIGAGLDFELGPLFEEKFELLNVDIVDLFNDSFQLEDIETTSFVLGAPAPDTDFGDAIVGSTGNDTLIGTSEADEIVALDGEDSIDAGTGNDTIFLGNGADSVDGGDGFDTLDLSDLQRQIAAINITSRFGDLDIIRVTAGDRLGVFLEPLLRDSSLVLPRGDMVVVISEDEGQPVRFPTHSAIGIERLVFTDLGDDVFITNDQGVEIYETGGGNDGIKFDLANQLPVAPVTVLAGDGDDVVSTVFSEIAAGSVLYGGDGYDYLEVFNDLDLEIGLGSRGETYFEFEAVAAHSGENRSNTYRGDGNDNTLGGGQGSDTLDGRGGNDLLLGGSESDVLIGGAGADSLVGGDGRDEADYSTASTSVFVDLDFGGVGRGFRGDAQGDVLEGVENVTGSDFEDILIGDNAGNTLDGGLGDDRLQSQGGGDLLLGGAGNDLLNRGSKAALGGSFSNTYDGGEGFDIVAIEVFDKFRQTGKYTVDDGGRFTFREGLSTTAKVAFRDIEIDYRYDRTAHVELVLDETGSGTIRYIEDDATSRFLATRIEGQAVYSSRNSIIDLTWDKRTSNYDINISDQSLSNLKDDNINYPRGDFHDLFGKGTVNSTSGAPSVRGGQFGSEQFHDIEGVIGSRGNDKLTGNSEENAFFGNGGSDLILGGAGGDRLGFGQAQPLGDVFSFPGSSGAQAPGVDSRIFLNLEERLRFLNPDGPESTDGRNDWTPAGKIQINASGGTQDIGSFLWGQAGIDTLDMRFDRGLGFFPDTSTNYAVVDLNVASANAPDNLYAEGENKQIQYGRAEWFNSADSRQAFATTYGIENVIGSRRDDIITGDRNDNTIEGLDGADFLLGDEGIDTASYALAEEGVTLNFLDDGGNFVMNNARATVTGTGDATGDFAAEFERYVGSDHDDVAVIEGTALSQIVSFPVSFEFVTQQPVDLSTTIDVTVTGSEDVSYAALDPDNGEIGLDIDLAGGADHLEIQGRGAHAVALGDGDDTALIRGMGHTIDAGAGNDVITVQDLEDLSLLEVTGNARITTISGGEGEDTVVFEGGKYLFLEKDQDGVRTFVVEITEPQLGPEQALVLDSSGQQVIDLTQQADWIEREDAIEGAFAAYQLDGVEIVEINGERVRLNNVDPIVDPDLALTVAEDQIDPYDLGLRITADDIAAGATFEVLSVPLTADLIFEGGQPLVAGQVVAAGDMAALRVFPGQNFDPAIDAFSYLRTGDPVEDTRTTILPQTVNGTALNITAHVTEVTTVIEPPATPDPEVALVRLNPAPVIGAAPPVADIQYLDGGVFGDMPSGSITLEFLFRSAGDFDPNGPEFSFLSYSGGGDNNEILIFGLKDERGIALVFNGRSVDTGYRLDQLFDREMHRVTAVFDTENNQIEMYVDGILVFDQQTSVSAGVAQNGFLVIGQEQDSPGGTFDANQIVKGDIGDIRIWDGVRSEAEIRETAFSEIADPAAEADLAAYWQADTANEGVLVNAVGDTHLRTVNGPEIVAAPLPAAPNVSVIPTIRMNQGGITDEFIQVLNTPMPTGDVTIEFVMQGLALAEEFTGR